MVLCAVSRVAVLSLSPEWAADVDYHTKLEEELKEQTTTAPR